MDDEKRPLIGCSELSKPATVLIEKISDAVEGIAKPWQIRRVAKAEADAKRIHADADTDVSVVKAKNDIDIDLIGIEGKLRRTELEREAMSRLMNEEAQKQINMESVTQKALPLLTENSSPQNMDKDWIVNFFDKSRIVSDDEMQNLWARVLAGEANTPGVYSRRTVNFISDMDKNDANLFTKLCCFALDFDGPLVFVEDYKDDIYKNNGITYLTLEHLDSIGLVKFFSIGSHNAKFSRLEMEFSYFGEKRKLVFGEQETSLNLGQVSLTKIGEELFSIAGGTPVYGFLDYVQSKWKNVV